MAESRDINVQESRDIDIQAKKKAELELEKAELEKAELEKAKLEKAELEKADLEDIDIQEQKRAANEKELAEKELAKGQSVNFLGEQQYLVGFGTAAKLQEIQPHIQKILDERFWICKDVNELKRIFLNEVPKSMVKEAATQTDCNFTVTDITTHDDDGNETDRIVISPPENSNNNKRILVIDGSNVAMAHGWDEVFSCKGIKIVVDYFKKKGHEVKVFVPDWCKSKEPSEWKYPVIDQHILEELHDERVLIFTPARKVGEKIIAPHDDGIFLEYAYRTGGIVVSRDHFNDFYKKDPKWKEVIRRRVLTFCFADDHFLVPNDPLGRNGPTLRQLLSCSPSSSEGFNNTDHSSKERRGGCGGRRGGLVGWRSGERGGRRGGNNRQTPTYDPDFQSTNAEFGCGGRRGGLVGWRSGERGGRRGSNNQTPTYDPDFQSTNAEFGCGGRRGGLVGWRSGERGGRRGGNNQTPTYDPDCQSTNAEFGSSGQNEKYSSCRGRGEQGHRQYEPRNYYGASPQTVPQGTGQSQAAKSKDCYKSNQYGHFWKECPNSGGLERKCFQCNSAGHIRQNCPYKKVPD